MPRFFVDLEQIQDKLCHSQGTNRFAPGGEHAAHIRIQGARHMSFLEVGKGRTIWIEALAGSSIRKAAGCAQCGARLETAAHDHSGKCFNCESYVSDEDEGFEELES
jgi:hypothetical protein